MLKELRISNFRLFDDEVTLRFRPITVFIGRNNSGKSSIIKFLLMLQQSLGGGSLGVGSPNLLQPEGDRVRFGPFENLKNSLTQKQQLEFELRVSNPHTLGGGLLNYLKGQGYLEPDETDIEKDRLLYATKAMIPYDTNGGNRGKYLEHEAKILLDSEEKLVINALPSEDHRLLKFPSYLDIPSYRESKLNAKVREHAPVTYLAEEETQENIVEVLQRNIEALKHLRAVRAEPARIIEASSPPPRDVGQDGRYTLPHLQKLLEVQPVYNFIEPHIRAVAGVREIIFEHLSVIDRVFAVNDKTGAKTYIDDFGFGASQCLPIFVQGALMHRHAHLMIEQPEAQLHPTAQLELGSFFADLWKKREVGSIIETHSDNILLRLRRLVAKGVLSTEDVSVAYFANDEEKDNMPIIKNLDINEDGSMKEGLPMEFFGKNLDEVLKMRMGK